MLTVAVLGPVEVRRDDVLLSLPAGKTTELLARLALDAGRLVRTDALVEDLWAEPTARNTVQSKVSQLRRAIGKELVIGRDDGYLLAVSPDAVDATRAVALAASGAAARTAGDLVGSLSAARAGLDLFRGDPLPEAGSWAAPSRARLVEVRTELLELAVAARVDLGAGAEIVAQLELLVEAHPLREGLWASLITALYRAGRQADALAAYGRVRRLLDEELGVQPGPALRSLERQVLRQDPQLRGRRSRPSAVPGNLPPLTAASVGREGDIVDVVTALTRHRLVTILGAGGVGKTRLALEVAHRLEPPPGGIWLLRLDAVDERADLTRLLAESLHVVGGEPALLDRLSGAATMLVVDNCEHLIRPVARLLRSLLDATPRMVVLATSQAPLELPGEHRHQLLPLSQDDSVELFSRLAREQRRQLVLDDPAVAAIEQTCRSLDGLPLAIELAAARVRSLSISEIRRRLDDRFALLRTPSSPRHDRRRTLVGAIAWSYELLFPDDQRALWALSAFADGAGLAALEHVLAALGVPGEAVPDVIARLVDRSLVGVDEVAGGELRYRLLDSIRLYALDQLTLAGLADVAFAAQAAWCARIAAWCDGHVRGHRQPDCLLIARAERANVDAALAWCADHDPELGARIATGFGWTWVVLGDGTAGAARIRAVLGDRCRPRDLVTGLLLAAWLEASAGDVELAQGDLDRAKSLTAALGDELLPADLNRHQAFLAVQQGRPERARRCAAAARAVYRDHGLGWQRAACLLLGAFGAIMQGDTAAAAHDANEALGILHPLGDSWGIVHGEAMLGAIAQAEHRFDDAGRALERAAQESSAMGFVGQAALHRASLARVRHRAGDPRAAATYEEALAAAVACGDGRLAATARVNLARLLLAHGDRADAVALLTENQRWYAAAGGGDYALLTRCLLAAAHDDVAELTVVLAEARASGNLEVTVHALDAVARLTASGDEAGARSLRAEADELAQTIAHVLDPDDRLDRVWFRVTVQETSSRKPSSDGEPGSAL